MRKIGKDFTGRDIYLASQKEVSTIYSEVASFINNIFGVSPVFISDESSLYDFVGTDYDVETIENVIDKVIKVYGIDISLIKENPIADIVKYIIGRIK